MQITTRSMASGGASQARAVSPPLSLTAGGASQARAVSPPLSLTAGGASQARAVSPPLSLTAGGASQARAVSPPLSLTVGSCFPPSLSQAATITALHHMQEQLIRATHTISTMQGETDTLKRGLALSAELSAKATKHTTNQTDSASSTATPSKSPDATFLTNRYAALSDSADPPAPAEPTSTRPASRNTAVPHSNRAATSQLSKRTPDR